VSDVIGLPGADGTECCGLAGNLDRKGPIVARKRPTPCHAVPPNPTTPAHVEPGAWLVLSRSKAHALRRNAPLIAGHVDAMQQLLTTQEDRPL
jgi:hypothetical protein